MWLGKCVWWAPSCVSTLVAVSGPFAPLCKPAADNIVSDVRNGVKLQVVRCDGQSGGLPGVRAQQWRVRSSERHSVPSVELMEPRAPFRPTGLCVDLTDGIGAAGTRMRLWGCSSTLGQAWGPA